jgi:hypothetical protein
MAQAMRSVAHPDAAEELAALVVEASGRRTREDFLADVAAAVSPIDREAAGWFESGAAPAGGPTVQRRVDRRTKRMEAYPPIDRKARPSAQDQGAAGAPVDAKDADPDAGGAPPGVEDARPPDAGDAPPGVEDARPPDAGDVSSNGRPARRPNAGGGPPTDKDAGP